MYLLEIRFDSVKRNGYIGNLLGLSDICKHIRDEPKMPANTGLI